MSGHAAPRIDDRVTYSYETVERTRTGRIVGTAPGEVHIRDDADGQLRTVDTGFAHRIKSQSAETAPPTSATDRPQRGARMTTKGLPALVTPYSTSEFHALVEAARAHHWAMQDQLLTIAAELHRALSRMQGGRGLAGLDVKIAARRVTRHLAKAGALNVGVAQEIAFSYNQFTRLFLNKTSTPSRTFDLDK